MPPPNMPLWQEDYCELKAIEETQVQETLSALPLFAGKQGILFPLWRCPPPQYQEGEIKSYHQK